MRVIKITSVVRPADVEASVRSVENEVCGRIENIRLKDGGTMIVNRDGATSGMPQNPIASLVAGTLVYGPALIVGEDEYGDYDDVPDPFYELLLIEP